MSRTYCLSSFLLLLLLQHAGGDPPPAPRAKKAPAALPPHNLKGWAFVKRNLARVRAMSVPGVPRAVSTSSAECASLAGKALAELNELRAAVSLPLFDVDSMKIMNAQRQSVAGAMNIFCVAARFQVADAAAAAATEGETEELPYHFKMKWFTPLPGGGGGGGGGGESIWDHWFNN